MPVPGVDALKTAKEFGTSPAEVLKRQLQLAPIIKALAPRADQPLVKPRLKSTQVAEAKPDAAKESKMAPAKK